VTTDAFGNLASDGGAIQRQIDNLGQRDKELADGIAISLALAQPMFQPGQNVAMRLGWGNFDGSNAIGFRRRRRVEPRLEWSRQLDRG
jgi:hypothetical protein